MRAQAELGPRESVLELSRLVRRDDCAGVPLTLLVGLCCRTLRRRGFDLLVSYADRTHGHHGGVYQACGWKYHGCRERKMDAVIVDGRFIPCRSYNSVWGTHSLGKLRERLPGSTIEPHFDNGKHLYWNALTPAGMAKAMRLRPEANPYPKPATAGVIQSAAS